jgi:hypothetical protein
VGVKFARALGAHVAVFTTSPGKKEDALRLGAHDITADVERIPIQKVDEAYERLAKSDVKYRCSIDATSDTLHVLPNLSSRSASRTPASHASAWLLYHFSVATLSTVTVQRPSEQDKRTR